VIADNSYSIVKITNEEGAFYCLALWELSEKTSAALPYFIRE